MIELEHAWGQGRSHKYIAKIGNRYFYSQDEIRAFKEGAQKKAGNAFDTARKGVLTVKKKVDSVPRIQKHGSKYYVADKKTQRKIEKSGAGGNDFYKVGSGHYKITKNGAGKMMAKDAGVIYRAKTTNADKIRDAVVKGTEAAKVKARKSAYSKYELGNVTKVNQGKAKLESIKNDVDKKADIAKKFAKRKINDAKIDAADVKDFGTQLKLVGKQYQSAKKIEKNNDRMRTEKIISNAAKSPAGKEYYNSKKRKTTISNANELAKIAAYEGAIEGINKRRDKRYKKHS